MESLEILISDYKRFVSAFLDVWPKQPSLAATAINKELRKLVAMESALLPKGLSVKPDALKKWAERGSIPSHPKWREALAICVERSVPQPPEGLKTALSFRLLMQEIESWRLGRDRLEEANDLLRRRGVIRLHPASSLVIDLEDFKLASSLTNGKVPTYIDRRIDEAVVTKINHINAGHLVLAGKSKSGKTRTLLECLRRSNKASWPVYTLTNTPGSVGEFVRIMRQASAKNLVMLIDDFQRFQVSLDSGGLNFESLMRLGSLGIVLVTMDAASLDSMREERGSRALNPQLVSTPNTIQMRASSLQEVVIEAAIRIEPQLEIQELEAAYREYGGRFANSDLQNLGAFFSSGEDLLDQFRSFSRGDLFSQAIHDSVLSANLLFPLGFEIEKLEEIARSEFKKVAPNGFWQELVYQEKMVSLTVGTYSGSPHTILIRSDDQPGRLVLHSYIRERFRRYAPTLDAMQIRNFASPQAAENVYRNGFADLALEIIRAYLESNPKDSNGHVALAGILFGESRLEESFNAITRACELDPQNSQAFYTRVESECLLGRFEAARALLETRIKARPNDYSAISTLIGVLSRLGLTREQIERSEELGTNDEFTESMKNLTQGFVLSQVGKFAEARKLYERAIEVEPNSCHAAANLVAICKRMGDYEEAFGVGRTHLSKCGGLCTTWANLGNLYIDLGMTQESQDLVDALDGEDFANAPKLNFLGRHLWLQGDIEGAIDHFKKAIFLEPWSALGHGNLGEALGELGNLEEAEEAFLAGLALDPADDQCLSGLGSTNYLRGDLHKASGYFDKALRANRGPHTLLMAARVRLELLDYNVALQLFQEAFSRYEELGLSGEQEWHYSHYSDCCINLGLFDNAVAILRQQYEKFPSADCLLHLCDLLRLQGQVQKAYELIELELDKSPENFDLHLVKALILENELLFREALDLMHVVQVPYSGFEQWIVQVSRLEIQLGLFDSAVETLSKNWRADHSNELMHGYFLAALRAAGKEGQASRIQEKLFELKSPSSLLAAIVEGDRLAKNLDSLKQGIERMVLQDGETPESLQLLGEVAIEQGRYLEAELLFERSLTLDGSWIDSALGLFEALVGSGEQQRAIDFLEDYRLKSKLSVLADEELAKALLSVTEYRFENQTASDKPTTRRTSEEVDRVPTKSSSTSPVTYAEEVKAQTQRLLSSEGQRPPLG